MEKATKTTITLQCAGFVIAGIGIPDAVKGDEVKF
jgi:hypothetical protein